MENLKRYDLQVNIGGGGQMVPCYEGEFVKFSDITEALKPAPNSGYTPCPTYRCNWRCRVGYKCKCGAIPCRVERHSV